MAKVQRWGRRGPGDEGAAGDVVEDDRGTIGETPLDGVPGGDGNLVEPPGRAGRKLSLVTDSTTAGLLVASHPRQAVVTALGMFVAALAADRPLREAAVVGATVLVGQAILGWHNDIVDRERDARHGAARKPIAAGRLEVGSAWYAILVAVLLVIPLSISTGVTAGTTYLVSLVIALVGNVALRQGKLSWLTWALSYALLPAYLSYGGWGGDAEGAAPEVLMTLLAALLGVGVHVLRSIWGLVADDAEGWTYLPLTLGRRLGATRLLVVAASYVAVVLALMVVVGGTVGLRQ